MSSWRHNVTQAGEQQHHRREHGPPGVMPEHQGERGKEHGSQAARGTSRWTKQARDPTPTHLGVGPGEARVRGVTPDDAARRERSYVHARGTERGAMIGSTRLGGPPNVPCPWFSGQIQELRWFREAWEEYAGRRHAGESEEVMVQLMRRRYMTTSLGNVIADAKCLVGARTYLESRWNHAAESASGDWRVSSPRS